MVCKMDKLISKTKVFRGREILITFGASIYMLYILSLLLLANYPFTANLQGEDADIMVVSAYNIFLCYNKRA